MNKKQPGAVIQITLFIIIWFVLQIVLSIPVILGPLEQSLEHMITSQDEHTMTISLSLGPLLAALKPGSQALFWLMFAGLLATISAVLFMQHFAAGPRLLDLGLRLRQGWLGEVTTGLLLGPLVFLAIVLIDLIAGWAQISRGSISTFEFGFAFITFIVIGVSEEIFLRGFVLQVLERQYSTIAAVIGSSVIFSLMHAMNPGWGPAAVIGIFIAGLLFSYAYLVTRQLWLPIALHISWNMSQGPIFGFPASGLHGVSLLNVSVTGPTLVTGGAFGPEAGLLVLLGAGLAAGIISVWRSYTMQ